MVGIKINVISFSVGKAELSNQDNIWLFILILNIYFLWRYYQYYQKYNLKVFDSSFYKYMIIKNKYNLYHQVKKQFGDFNPDTRGANILNDFENDNYINNLVFKNKIRKNISFTRTEKEMLYHKDGAGIGEIKTELYIRITPMDKLFYIIKQPYWLEYIFPFVFGIISIILGFIKFIG